MRTIDECRAILDKAKADGMIYNWDEYDNTNGCDIWKRYIVWISGDDGYVEFYKHRAAADYVLSLYPKEATPEPMTCRCKRMVWDDSSKMWSDHDQDCLWTTITCPDCNTKCLPTGVVCYQEGAWLMLSTPYKEDDLLGLKKQKEETVKIKLSEAVSSIMGDTSGIIGVWIIVWGENPTGLQEVVKAFRKHQALSTCQRHVSSFSSMPVESKRSAANIIIHVTGGPTGMTLEITKNRHGKMRRFDCMADCYFKESNMNQNDVEKKAWPYKHLHCDSAGYAECFRILREARKDGVIRDYGYYALSTNNNPMVSVWKYTTGCGRNFDDTDGTKGDIGILREAADYVLGLRKAKEKPDLKTMNVHQCQGEIADAGCIIVRVKFTGTDTPTLMMQNRVGHATCSCLQIDEPLLSFYRRCVEYIRGLEQ